MPAGLTYFSEGESMTGLQDGSVHRAPLPGAVGDFVGVPSPDGRVMAWLGLRPHSGDFVGLTIVELATGRTSELRESAGLGQFEWVGWSFDGRRAYFRNYDDAAGSGDQYFDTRSWSTGRGRPGRLAAQQVPNWRLELDDVALQRRLLTGVAASGVLPDARDGAATDVLTVQRDRTGDLIAFSTLNANGLDLDPGLQKYQCDVWTAGPDGTNIRWVGHGLAPVWDAVLR